MEEQSHLNAQPDMPPVEIVISELTGVLSSRAQPSPWELIKTLCDRLGPKARWVVTEALRQIIEAGKPTRANRDYLISMLESEDWELAMQSTERHLQRDRHVKLNPRSILSFVKARPTSSLQPSKR